MGGGLVLQNLAGAEAVADLQDCHAGGETGEEQALLDAAVAAADHQGFLASIEGAVAGGAEVYAGADKVVLAGDVEATVTGAPA